MKPYLFGFCLFLSYTISAQSVFDENMISGDNLREMIKETFNSPEGEQFLQFEGLQDHDIVFLINTNYTPSSEQRDVRNALIDIKNNPADLGIVFPIRIIDEAIGEIVSPISMVIKVGVSRDEDQTVLQLQRNHFTERKFYSLSTIFEKKEDDWEFIKQNMVVSP